MTRDRAATMVLAAAIAAGVIGAIIGSVWLSALVLAGFGGAMYLWGW